MEKNQRPGLVGFLSRYGDPNVPPDLGQFSTLEDAKEANQSNVLSHQNFESRK